MLGPHLTAENLTEVLARAKHRTKKEIARLNWRIPDTPKSRSRIHQAGSAPPPILPNMSHRAPERGGSEAVERTLGASQPARTLDLAQPFHAVSRPSTNMRYRDVGRAPGN
jgi:hypothetical protein